MIHYVKREDLEVEMYNGCIENSIQSRIYAFSWYLDIVADHWDVLVLNDYEAVMPIPWRKKYGIKYVYPPLWLLELGVFSIHKEVVIYDFLEILSKRFKFVRLRLNTENTVQNSKEFLDKEMQYISLNNDCDSIFKGYNRNRKREIIRAKNSDLIENWNDNPEKLIKIFRDNIATRIKGVTEKDFSNLLELMRALLEKKVGELLTIYDIKNNLVSAAFFLKYKNEVTQLVCASDIGNRKNGAHTFFNHRAIFKFQPNFDRYNFGGSSMKSIAKYYQSFGAETKQYQQLEYNNLPFLIRLIKK
jgi:hypothetical protein